MNSKVSELYGHPTHTPAITIWREIIEQEHCPFLGRKCLKIRKSEPDRSIGSCSVSYGKGDGNIIICPHRLLERNQIFTDCLHLLTLHEPGNEIHIVAELSVPGGSIDYCLVSVRDEKAKDFVGIELQTLDTTGTIWPERQRFAQQHGVAVREEDVLSNKKYGVNWKMTAKTILVQLHHKIQTFEHINKKLVLVAQDLLMNYMRTSFSFGHLVPARIGDSMHFHSYRLAPKDDLLKLELADRISTDSNGIAQCLGLQMSAKVEMEIIIQQLEAKLSSATLLELGS